MMNKRRRSFGKERRGVGMIIGGVILMAILLTSVFTFYFTILNNDKARAGYEIQSQQESRDKELETFVVDRETEIASQSVDVKVNNTGSIPMVASHALLYCSVGPGCSNPGVPIQDQDITETLNPGESLQIIVGGVGAPMDSGNTYTISVISERGNIISSTTCTVQADGTCSEDSGGPGGLDEGDVQGIFNEGIVQGTGSLQLDYRAFGAIFPQLATRDGVNQQGWNVVTGSGLGNATGYPAFEIPYEANVIFVQKMRNLDIVGEDIKLARSSALLTNQGTVPPGQQAFEYICNRTGTSATAYNENTAYTLLPVVPVDAENTEGWREVYFCTDSPGTAYSVGTGYYPESTNDQLNGIIAIVRGTFSDTKANYGQTIPYQAAQPGSTEYTTFYWCLYNSNVNPGSTCPAPGTASTLTQDSTLVYTADRATMQAGLGVWAHYRSSTLPNSPATATWIYPDGTHVVLREDRPLNSNFNLDQVLNLPTTNSDGTTPIDCAPGDSEAYFIIKINDSFDSLGKKNTYYMTFRMTCP